MFTHFPYPRKFPRWLGTLIALFTLSLTPAESSRSDEEQAWRYLATLFPNQASALFQQLDPTHSENPRSLLLGRALILMASQPTTEGRLRQCAEALQELVTVPDEVGHAALYFLGRLHQIHFNQPDFIKAAEFFERLMNQDPEGFWGQNALIKLATLQLFVLPEAPTAEETYQRAAALELRAVLPQTRRDLALLLSEARLHRRWADGETLRLLRMAGDIGGLDTITQADVTLQIAELSRLHNDNETALTHYHLFVQTYPRDVRNFFARERIREMTGQVIPAPQIGRVPSAERP